MISDKISEEISEKISEEKVGPAFQDKSLRAAQAQAWRSLAATAARLRAGDTEKGAAKILKEILKADGVEKIWHPPQIRFGKNTTLAFGKRGDETVTLKSDDIFFLDIGPVFFGHEGDVGDTFVIGTNSEHHRIAADSKKVFNETRDEWLKTGRSGGDLYEFAKKSADDKGWILSLGGASGHRVSDFPHAVHYRGKLKTFDKTPTANRWILEIHLLDPDGAFGGFFEDLL